MANKKKRSTLGRLWVRTKADVRHSPVLAVMYIVLRVLVIGIMIAQFFNRNYLDVVICIYTLVLFMIPSFVEKRIKIDVPDTLEVIILLFIFAAEILGELQAYYINVPHWDTMLHTVNGFLCAAIGFSMIDILNRSDRINFYVSPLFAAVVSFTFSMTIGVLWEFIEFGVDRFFMTDMQKDTVVETIKSVYLNPDGLNIPVVIDVDSVVVNGEVWNIGGYLDIGLIDTMKDLLVNFVGAIIFSIIGFFYVKRQGDNPIIRNLVPTRMQKAGPPMTSEQEEEIEDVDPPGGKSVHK